MVNRWKIHGFETDDGLTIPGPTEVVLASDYDESASDNNRLRQDCQVLIDIINGAMNQEEALDSDANCACLRVIQKRMVKQ